MTKKKLVLFSGAGMSAESGLKTFRDNNGLWEDHNIYEVATPEAWKKDPELVLKFYNERRLQLKKAKPNKAHLIVAEFEKFFDVTVITQNVDNLHELAGSKRVLHLHGELTKVRDELKPEAIYDIKTKAIKIGDLSEFGNQLRPHVVWFGEEVPMMVKAFEIAMEAEIFIVIGTSLSVYPAANIITVLNNNCKSFVIDPTINHKNFNSNWTLLQTKASNGLEILFKKLTQKKER